MKKLLKWTMFSLPVGGLGYYTQQSYFSNSSQDHNLSEPELAEHIKKYVEEHNLISPRLYKNYQRKYKFDHFFEKSILKELSGLQNYNVFMDKGYHDVLIGDTSLSPEQKDKLHKGAKLHCTFTASSYLQKQEGMLHAGFVSTLFDNTAGMLAFLASDFMPSVTAYLNINYKKPLTIGTDYVAIIEVDKIDGRKIFLKGKIVDKENNVHTTLETLYIKVKWDNFYLKHIYKSLLLDKGSSSSLQKSNEELNIKPILQESS